MLLPNYGRQPRRKRRLGSVASRKALKELNRDADTIECCLMWLLEIVRSGHDPRAIAAFVDEYDWHQFTRADLVSASAAFSAILDAYAKHLHTGLTVVPPEQDAP